MFVFDATPLIYLAKVERLRLVVDNVSGAVVPEPVHDEVVVDGIDGGHADARRIERAVESGALEVVPVQDTDAFDRIAGNERLTEADAAVLAVAASRDAVAVMDEQYGRDVADAEGIETRGTAFLALSLLRDGVIDAEEARATIDEMVDAGWYCAPDLYAKLLGTIEELS
jgi:predicted nucleic acid-binding protein